MTVGRDHDRGLVGVEAFAEELHDTTDQGALVVHEGDQVLVRPDRNVLNDGHAASVAATSVRAIDVAQLEAHDIVERFGTRTVLDAVGRGRTSTNEASESATTVGDAVMFTMTLGSGEGPWQKVAATTRTRAGTFIFAGLAIVLAFGRWR